MRTFVAILARIAALAAIIVFQGANASLVTRDLDAPGDHLLTFDDQTGLEWLDVPATVGLTPTMLISGAGGYFARGFRYATDEEVIALALDAGVSPQYYVTSFNNWAGIFALQYFYIGYTSSYLNSTQTEGYAALNERAPNTVDTVIFALENGGDRTGELAIAFTPPIPLDATQPETASFLVRDTLATPEPATVALLGIGLAGLGLSRRRGSFVIPAKGCIEATT